MPKIVVTDENFDFLSRVAKVSKKTVDEVGSIIMAMELVRLNLDIQRVPKLKPKKSKSK
jgi:hypothetical protein